MDFNGFPYNQSPEHSDRSRDRDRYSQTHGVRHIRHRDQSPVRPRSRGSQSSRDGDISDIASTRFPGPEVHRQLTRSEDSADFIHRFQIEAPASDSRDRSPPRTKSKLFHSAPPEMFRIKSKADIRKEAYAYELEQFHRSLYDVPDLKHFKAAIKSVKNFEIAEKYFWEIYRSHLEPDGEAYQLMIKAALEEDNFEKAVYFSETASHITNIAYFYEDLMTRYLVQSAPLKAVKVLQLAGPDFLGKFLEVAEQAQPPPFVYSYVMELYRHKGEKRANIPAAEALLGFVHRNRVPVEKLFYMRLADIYYERGFLPQAYSVLDNHLPYEIKEEKGLDKLDTHDWTPRAALMMITDYLIKRKRTDDDFFVVTGKGKHSKDEKYLKHTMRDFILYNQGVLPMGWDISVDETNSGMLIFKNKIRRA